MKAQTVASGQELGGLDSMNKVCMEINPNHPIIKDLDRMIKADKDGKETEDYAKLLFDVAGMTSGYDIEDMSGFAKRVMGLMTKVSDDDEAGDPVDAAVVEKKEVKTTTTDDKKKMDDE